MRRDADLPYVTTNATNNFGHSGIFVEGADVTIQGLEIGPNAAVRQQDASRSWRRLHAAVLQDQHSGWRGAVYFNDWLYDDDTATSQRS